MNEINESQVQVEFTYSPVINFSLQQNHVPIIRALSIKNNSETDLGELLVEIETEPNVILNWKQHIPLIKNQDSFEMGAIQLSIDSQYLAELTEKITGYFTLTVTSGDLFLYQKPFPVDILAYDQWNGIVILPELLVSFITPNHPEISKIIRRASQILEKWTSNPSFDEYQNKSPDRVRKQMAAIYEAIAEMQITYCSAPASFEETGQRIRLLETIISYRLANCLDLTLLFAGCLEAVGIHPLIIIIKGHCFAGGWLVDQSFSNPVNDDSSLLTKRVAEGINEIALVEATCMNGGNNNSFDQACFIANQKMLDTRNFILFIDAKRARFSVRPLPLRIQTSTGWEIHEEKGIERETQLPTDIEPTEGLLYTDRVKVSKQLLWERKLLDLTLRNSLLNIRVTKSVIQFITINPATLEDALASGDEFQVLSKPLDWDNPIRDSGIYRSIHHSDPITDLVKSELLQKRLRSYLSESELTDAMVSLFRSSRLSFEENGANTLYIGLGLLKWYETRSSEKARYAPLLLMPIEIIRKSAQKGYVIRGREEETIINITLLEMIRLEFGVAIGGLEILPKDESGVDVKKIFTIIRQAVMSQSRWDVEETAIMGSFSFNKFILWNDIHHNHFQLRKNKVVESLITGKLAWPAHEEEIRPGNLDQDWLPSKLNIPIPFDSSQLEAIIDAGMDKSFVLHGPPGTGKSQTITNMISSALYSGKKVLFVAAKKAALEVVEDRLNAIGIGPFCLELHSNKSKKSAVIEQLKEATQITFKNSPQNYDAEAQRLASVRTELNIYVAALHQKHSFGFSLYEAFNAFISVNSKKDMISFPPASFESLEVADLIRWNDLVQEMQILGIEIGHPKGHALSLIHIPNYSAHIKELSIQAIENLLVQLSKIKKESISIKTLLSFNDIGGSFLKEEALNTLVGLLLKIPDTPASLFQAGTKEQTLAQIIGITDHGIKRDICRQDLLLQFREEILQFPAEQALTDWKISSGKWILPRWSFQRALRGKLKRLSTEGRIDKQQIPEVLDQIIRFQQENKVIQDADFMTSLLGFLAQKDKVNWEQLKIICETLLLILQKAVEIEDSGNITGWRIRFSILCKDGSKSFLSFHNATLLRYQSIYMEIVASFSNLNKLLGINFNASAFISDDWIGGMTEAASRWLENTNRLKDWYNWLQTKENLVKVGLQPLVTAYENGSIESAEIIEQYLKGFYRSAAEYIIECSPVLTSFNGRLFEDKIRKFREISKNFELLTREELYAKLASRVPSFIQEAAQSSEIGILQKNIRNNGRASSIRKIFDDIPNLLHRLTPCMLMSPISVAQYFDANSQRFDLVIFDEASQLPTCEAVSAMARAKNVIVVGDPKQLPPTSFFTSNNTDDDNIEKEDLESILEDCLALSMPSQHLLWHYRSKHESLIAFSNAKYYDNKLLTFPSIDDIHSKVEFVLVKGTYDRGKTRQNIYEARAIVEEVVRRLSDPLLAKLSIGIVTFSSVQQTLIEDSLNDVFTLRPDLERIALEAKEPIFIKNLENVQGDERDVILFSICYGPDEEGKVSLTLGPLTREGGWRRLNVAVSRARYEMKIFSTLRSEQIDIRRSASEGVSGLRDFLAYAEKGRSALPIRTRYQIDEDASFENLLADKIRKLGYEVHTQIGSSGYKIDLGIVNREKPGEYILGILCDGKNYHTSKTARDREIVQVDILKLLGWSILRVWSTEWWEKPEAVVGNIMESIRLVEEKPIAPPVISIKPEVSPLPETAFLNAALEINPMTLTLKTRAKPYMICRLEIVASYDSGDFLFFRNKDKIISQIEQILNIESPISRDLLCKRVLDAWGIERLGSRISSYFDKMFLNIRMLSTDQENNIIFWKNNNPDNFTIYRVASQESDKRNADDLPVEEVANGVLEILLNQISLSKSDLIRETAGLFGYSRIGTNVEMAMSLGIEMAIVKGYGYKKNDRIILNEPSH